MFGIGGTEFLLIAAVALLLFGPDKLPQIARSITIDAASNPPSTTGFSWSTTTPGLLSLSASASNRSLKYGLSTTVSHA